MWIRSGRCSPQGQRRSGGRDDGGCGTTAAQAPPRRPPVAALIGVLDVGANACFALGADTGLLSVVSVLASLYGVDGAARAGDAGGEADPDPVAGVTVALAGVALIATG